MSSGVPKALDQAIKFVAEAEALSLQEISGGARIASAAVPNIVSGKLLDTLRSEGVSKRQQMGSAETLSRLVTYLNDRISAHGGELEPLNIDDVLRGFELDPDSAHVIKAKKVALSAPNVEHLPDDPVLRQIALRDREPDGRRAVRVGLIRWRPFFNDKEEARSSWAGRFTSRLIGSIDPLNWTLELDQLNGFDEAVQLLGSKSNRLDAIFGLYDTMYRRLKGISFVNIPGLAIPLGLMASADADDEAIWRELVEGGGNVRLGSDSTPFKAVVLSGEVGQLFLKGPCQFGGDQLIEVPSADPDRVLDAYIEAVEDNPLHTVVVCADRGFCKHLRERARARSGKSALLADLDLKDTSRDYTPKYALGFGVRSDAKEWHGVLRDAQCFELFGSTRSLTAKSYAQLLVEAHDSIALVPLTSELDGLEAELFVGAVWRALENMVRHMSETPRKEILGKLRAKMFAGWRIDPLRLPELEEDLSKEDKEDG